MSLIAGLNMPSKIEISHKTIIFSVFFMLTLYFLFQIKNIIFLVYASFILMSAFNPVTGFLEKLRIPRVISVILFYILLILLLIFIGSAFLPPVITQTAHLAEKMPEYIGTVLPMVKLDMQVISQQIAPLGENLVKVTIGIFSNVITIFTIFVVSFYFLIERQHLEEHLSNLIGKNTAGKYMTITGKVEDKLGAWVRGQLTLVLTIGLATFVGLTALGMPFALSLSLFAAIMEIVPIVGPIISAIPAILIAFTISPVMAVAALVVYFIIQQTEANLIVPVVMKRAVGLPPIVSIVALLVGAQLDGIIGALLAVPLVLTVETIISEYVKLKDSGV